MRDLLITPPNSLPDNTDPRTVSMEALSAICKVVTKAASEDSRRRNIPDRSLRSGSRTSRLNCSKERGRE